MRDPFTNHKRYRPEDYEAEYRFPTLGVLSVALLILLGLLLFVVPALVTAWESGNV